MNAAIQDRQSKIRGLIQDTNELFENSGGVNTDYADFATIALADFKELLRSPTLTDRQLKQLIRKANNCHRSDDPQGCWATFMARHIAKQANDSSETIQ